MIRKHIFRPVLMAVMGMAVANSAAADCAALGGQTIRWIVPSRPGGGYDAYSRLLQPFLEQRLSAQIVIENRQEAGGIVAAIAIRDAAADGKTLGLINASGLLAASVISDNPAPEPSQDFTIIARVVSNSMFLFTGPDSGISNIRDLLQVSTNRPIVVGVRDVGSASFFATPITAELLGLNYVLVTGYVGSSTRALAALRGEVDIILQNYDSVRRYVDAGELLPLLQISGPATTQQELKFSSRVPSLSGLVQPGAAVSATTGMDAEHAVTVLSGIISAGRLVVAPVGLEESTRTCLQSAVLSVLQSVQLQHAAGRAGLTIQAADATRAREDLIAGNRHLSGFTALVRSAIEQARQ